MKELSIEEKAKRFDEALGKARRYYDEYKTRDNILYVEDMEDMFPELKENEENEDERIRKELISLFQDCIDGVNHRYTGSDSKRWLAWLRKQGEHANFRNKIQIGDKVTRNEDGVLVNLSQLKRIAKPAEEYNITGIRSKNAQGKLGEMIKKLKPVNEVLEQNSANKVEPKFKIEKDKWYICIRDLYDNYGTKAFCKGSTYHSTEDETLIPDNSNVPFEIKYCVNDYFRLWTIQDAKDGDLLANDHHILILKELGYTWASNGKSECLYAYCGIKPDGNFELEKEHYCFCGILHIHPATKEQRNLLFQKMCEAGYKWDAENKELKKIEDEPTWGEEDEKMMDIILNDINYAQKNFSDSKLTSYDKKVEWLKNKLKSLRPQKQWKPSDEQMKALADALSLAKNCGEENAFDLRTLYEQLKKLREE